MRSLIHPKPINGSDWFTAFIDDFASGKLTGFILVESQPLLPAKADSRLDAPLRK